jgi:hypothetical protein
MTVSPQVLLSAECGSLQSEMFLTNIGMYLESSARGTYKNIEERRAGNEIPRTGITANDPASTNILMAQSFEDGKCRSCFDTRYQNRHFEHS